MPLENIIPLEINEYFGKNTKQSIAKLLPGFSSEIHDMDLSEPGIAKTRGGSLRINADPIGFGTGALELNGVGTADYASIPDSGDFDFSGGTWTVNLTFEIRSFAEEKTLFSQITDATNYKQLVVTTAGRLRFEVVSGGSVVVTMTSAADDTIVSFTEYQVEVVENANDYFIFLDGVQDATVSDTSREANYTGAFEIGRLNVSGSFGYFIGRIDDFRVSDIARHTSGFTKYSAAFATDGNTQLLLGFEGDDHSTTITDASASAHTITATGGARIHTGKLPFTPKRIVDRHAPSTNRHSLMINGAAKIIEMQNNGRWATLDSTLTTSATIFDFLNYGDDVFMADGFNFSRVLQDGAIRRWGIVAPTTKPEIGSSGTGPLTGTYSYRYTFRNSTSGHESTASSISNDRIATNEEINLTNIAVSTDSQVDKKRIYRTTAGGATYLFVAEIDNADTTFADSVPDTSLGSTEAPLDNGPPSKFKGIEEFDGRIFGFKPFSTRVEFSNDEFLTPAGTGVPEESFSPDNCIDFRAIVYGIKKSPNFNELWVHTSVGVFGVRPTNLPEDPYIPVNRNSSWFAVSHYSLQNIFNDQWFQASNGKLISIDSAGSVNYESYLIEPDLGKGNIVQYANNQAGHYRFGTKNQYRMLYPKSGQVTPNQMLGVNYLSRTPSDENGFNYPVIEPHDITADCLGVVKDGSDQDRLYTGHSDGYIKRQDFTTNDDGVAIDWLLAVGFSRAALKISTSLAPRWLIHNLFPIGDWNINFNQSYDFGLFEPSQLNIKAAPTGDTLDGTFTFDTSVWADLLDLVRVTKDLRGEFHYWQSRYSGSTKDETMELHNIEILPIQKEGFRR